MLRTHSFSRNLLISVCSFLLFSAIARGQILNVTDTTSTPIPGAGHDYIKMLSETVNPANGSVSIRIQTPVPPGRKLTIPFAFAYDSNGVHFPQQWPANQIGWASNTSFLSNGGWSYSLPMLTASYFSQSYTVPVVGITYSCGYSTGFVLQDPSGGRHSLGLGYISSSSSSGGESGCAYFNISPSTVNWGGDPQFSAAMEGTGGGPPFVVWDNDGTLYHFAHYPLEAGPNGAAAELPDFVEDRNGNKATFTDSGGGAFTSVDTLGRTAVSSSGFGASGNTVTVDGLSASYTVDWTSTSYNYSVGGTLGSTSDSYCATAFPSTSGTQSVISSIVLPNNQAYTFYYDSTYGLLNKIVYPTGGYVRYVWGINSNSETSSFADEYGNATACPYFYGTPAVLQRYVSFNGSTEVLEQSFTYSTTWGSSGWTSKQTTVTTYDLLRGGSFQTTYLYSPASAPGIPYMPSSVYGVNLTVQIPLEQTVTYGDWNGSTARTVNKTWLDPYRMACQQTILGSTSPGSMVLFYYAGGTQVAEKDEYDFGTACPSLVNGSNPSPAPTASLLRKTRISYQSFGNTPLFPSTFFPSGAPIIDRPNSVTICSPSGTGPACPASGGGAQVAQTIYGYDAAGLTSSGVGTGHDSYYLASMDIRGNATSKLVWNSTAGTNNTTTYTYYDTGQVFTMTEPCGNTSCPDMTGSNFTTHYSYADSYASGSPPGQTNAYLTQVTDPLGLTTSYAYYYASGELASSTDASGQTTTYEYNDPLARLTQTNYPDTGETTISYNDSPPNPSVTTQKLITSGVWATSTAVMDGMGHVVTTLGENGAKTVTGYDATGHLSSKTNPYFSTSDPTYGVTTYTFDALGRSSDDTIGGTLYRAVTHPDGSYISITYSGNETMRKDENGNPTNTWTDALGRIYQVQDPLGNITSYTHNALDDLTNVNQGGQTRSFSYNSLSQLTSETTPEAGTTNFTSYDADGNLATKTDNRGVTTNCGYDADNHLIQKSYQNDPSGTPTVTYTYATSPTASVTIGSWTSGTLTNTAGRLIEAATGGGTPTAEVYGYDQMGRTNYNAECVASQCGSSAFTLGYSYWAEGSPNQVTTPAATFAYNYANSQDQLTAVTSSLNDAQHPATLFSNAQYNALGDLAQATLANAAIPEYANYNNRGWITGVGAGSGAVLGTAGSGSVTISGSPQSRTSVVCTPREPLACYEVTIYETGTVSITVNGVTSTAGYGGSSTSSQIASSLASAVSSSGAGVSASASGSTVYITATGEGSQTDYQLSTSYTFNSPFTTPAFTATASGSTLTGGSSQNGTGAYNFTLAHDHVGNVTNANDSVEGNQTFQYDAVNRLVTAKDSGGQAYILGYSYDAYGNITFNAQNPAGTYTSLTYNSAQNNHLTAIGNTTVNYDLAGDMLNDVNCSYTYDGEQRMGSATCGGVATLYVYDGEGQRVAKLNASGVVSEQDVYNTAGQVLMRYNGSGGWLEGEVWARGNHLAIYANGQTYFPLTDQVGTERARFASTGGIVQTCMSQPFGDNLQCTGTDSSPYKFGKLERDLESGDDHAQHRDYNSNPYRWLTPDPAGEKVVVLTDPQTWNLYVYSHDNPVTDNDPTGEQESTEAPRCAGSDASPCASGFQRCTLSSGQEPCGDQPAPQNQEETASKAAVAAVALSPAAEGAQATAAAAAGDAATATLAILPLIPAAGSVIAAADLLITNVTNTLVENYNGEAQLSAIESVVTVENSRALSLAKGEGGQRKGERAWTAKPDKPAKHARPSKEKPGQWELKDPHTGKWVIKPPGWKPSAGGE
jgi:RHS repeat-associated protein